LTTDATTAPPGIPALSWPVQGRNLEPGTLGDQLDPDGPTLMAFLRHAGCCFCRELIGDLRRAAARRPGFPRVILVHQGTVADGDELIARLWPTARAVADPEGRLYLAFGVPRGGGLEMFGPRSCLAAVRAVAKGNGVGRKVGDAWTLPTLVALEGGRVVWEHRGTHAGDHPDLGRVPHRDV
jgi:hypothetical protein